MTKCLAQLVAQLVVVPRFGQELVDCAAVNCPGDGVEVSVAGEYDADGIRIEFPNPGEEFGPAHLGHPLVGEDHLHVVGGQQLEPFLRAAGGQNPIALAAQQTLQGTDHADLVVDDQERRSLVFWHVGGQGLENAETRASLYRLRSCFRITR